MDNPPRLLFERLPRPRVPGRSAKQLLTGGKTVTTLSCYSGSKRARKLGIWGFGLLRGLGMILAYAYYAAGRPGWVGEAGSE